YIFLRRLENAIQALHDQQTHRVPEGEDLDRVTRALGFENPAALLQMIDATRASVGAALDEHFPQHEASPPDVSWRDKLERAPGTINKPMQD
ncbi:MAG: hypothetical protein GWN87_21290, partial [Desulfuromonadales bacterium]|nr:hypothetical protein [Desulfuromonadales bacterium]